MIGPRSAQKTETIRAVIVLVIITATYLVVVKRPVLIALWREFVSAI